MNTSIIMQVNNCANLCRPDGYYCTAVRPAPPTHPHSSSSSSSNSGRCTFESDKNFHMTAAGGQLRAFTENYGMHTVLYSVSTAWEIAVDSTVNLNGSRRVHGIPRLKSANFNNTVQRAMNNFPTLRTKRRWKEIKSFLKHCRFTNVNKTRSYSKFYSKFFLAAGFKEISFSYKCSRVRTKNRIGAGGSTLSQQQGGVVGR